MDDEDRVGGKKSRRENQVRMKFHASFYFQSQLNSIASWVHVHQNEDHLLRICLNWVSIAPHSLGERRKRARNEIIDQVFGRCVWQLFWRLRARQLHSVLTQKLSFSPHYYFHSSDLLARAKKTFLSIGFSSPHCMSNSAASCCSQSLDGSCVFDTRFTVGKLQRTLNLFLSVFDFIYEVNFHHFRFLPQLWKKTELWLLSHHQHDLER